MKSMGIASFVRLALIILGVVTIVGGGIYIGSTYITPAPPPEVALPVLTTATSTATITPAQSSLPTATPIPLSPAESSVEAPTATPRPETPPGGIVYSLEPDINSIGWVQSGETGNHFGESFLYVGLRDGVAYYGAMQFDLSFIPKGSTIFLAELELTGLADQGLTDDSSFALNILSEEVNAEWSRHNFDIIQNAVVDEALKPVLEATDLAVGQPNKFTFNAAQRSIIEARLAESHLLSFRIDSLFPEGWFGWDTGYGPETQGRGPALRLGVIPPAATDVVQVPVDSTPTTAPTFVVITSTPAPENVLTAAAVAPALTAQATTTGTPTPLPQNWVTPLVVTSTPIPENTATALFQQAAATAAVIAYGTSTPTPQNLLITVPTPTPTETSTPIFILMDGELPPMTPVPTLDIASKPTPSIPPELMGKIVFKSNRTGREALYVINPDGTELALLTNRWAYNMAKLADTFSPDGRYRVYTKDMVRYVNIEGENSETGETVIIAEPTRVPALFVRDAFYKEETQVTFFGAGIAYGGVWSPISEKIAFISNDSADDEIWVVDRDGSNLLQLTTTNEAYNAREIGKDTFVAEVSKDPSWSPNGEQIVFWSNRTGHGQIWIMNADGSNLYSLSRTGFDDWDPVWIKYPGLPEEVFEKHAPYIGPYNPLTEQRNCSDFDAVAEPHESAQSFYWAAGGPARDPHGLDTNNDGIACN